MWELVCEFVNNVNIDRQGAIDLATGTIEAYPMGYAFNDIGIALIVITSIVFCCTCGTKAGPIGIGILTVMMAVVLPVVFAGTD